jgi:phosphoribosylanthranilate isomerase
MIRVKVCGIRSVSEARLAESAGAHALGLLAGQFHAAGDFLDPGDARDLAIAIPPFLVTVLVTHLEDVGEILTLADRVPTAVVQLHSDLDPRALEELRGRLAPRKVVGKVSVEDGTALERARALEPFVDALVLDSRDRAAGRVGGTGLVHDWSISARIAATSRVPVVLAGGLTPDNVAEAIRAVRPWGVDVNSGVEAADGSKDPELLARFVRATSGDPAR